MKLKIKYKEIIFTTLLFMFIYSFPIYGLLNSSYLANMIAFGIVIFSSKKIVFSYDLLKNKFSVFVFLFYFFIVVYSIVISCISGSYDFYIIKPWINNVISVIGAILLITIYISYFSQNDHFERFLFYILLIQSIYIIIAILFPELSNNILMLIRTQAEIEKMSIYGGIRGVGLSGSMAFGLAITMSILGFFSTIWLFKYSTMSFFLKFIVLLICIFASFSAGRTAILGYLLGFFLVSPYIFNKKNIFGLLALCPIIVIFLIYLYENNTSFHMLFNKYSAYVFEPITLFLNTGSFKVSSLKSLESMYFMPPIDTFIIGDAKYVDPSNPDLYYMGTDSGYMRFILYYGLLGSLIPYFAFLFLCFYVVTKCKSKQILMLYSLIILMSFIFHYKGEVVFFAVDYMKILFLVSFYLLFKNGVQYDDSRINPHI
ncbi:hypothetical protein [Ignatzschineria cameli]|uniref:hypothetical protein n=1 Tax=Ignatzschineria cameli TaxID=2182793 RepID=UPI000D61B374|nr:hypothetical protein [Ignatzschineria cameli]PWD85361.1 hypothetical protein DC080_06805 [Ignatzschineria cameli]